MAEMTLPTIVEGNNGFGGAGGMGAGFIGGLVLGSIWNGGWGGWGGNGRGNAVADVGLANAVEHVGDAVNQGTISQLQSSNQLGLQMANTSADVTGAINQGTISQLQSNANLSEKLCCINNNITTQGYESRLQAQALAAQLQNQHAELSAQIFRENCEDRALMRDIQAQAVRDQLVQSQAQNAALVAQINLTNQLTQQTAYLIDQLKPAATTA